MKVMILVTPTNKEVIYKLDPRTKKILETYTNAPERASRLSLSWDTKHDFEFQNGSLEDFQVPLVLTGLDGSSLKAHGFTHVLYFNTANGNTKEKPI